MNKAIRVTTVVIGVVIGAVGIVCVVLAIIAYPTMLLWNWLGPETFNLNKITYWQALGLQTLTTLLFRSYHANTKS